MHSRYSRLFLTALVRAIAFCCGLLMLVGCGSGGGGGGSTPEGKIVPVQGKVTCQGKALPDGDVLFYAIGGDTKAPSAMGKIEKDGSYTLATNGNPGVPVGKYRAVVSPGEDDKSWLHVGAIYTNEKKEPLEIDVVENKPAGGYDLKLLPKRTARK